MILMPTMDWTTAAKSIEYVPFVSVHSNSMNSFDCLKGIFHLKTKSKQNKKIQTCDQKNRRQTTEMAEKRNVFELLFAAARRCRYFLFQ